MSEYKIEDLDLLREKCGISYDEAITVLDSNGGSLAHALADLERSGKLITKQPASGGSRFRSVLARLYAVRIKLHNGDTVLVNLSVITAAIAVVVSPVFVLIASAAALLLGFRFRFVAHDSAFSDAMLGKAWQDTKTFAYKAYNKTAAAFRRFQRNASEKAAAENDPSDRK